MKVLRVILIILLVAGLGAGGYYAYTQYQLKQSSQSSLYQTELITRGDLTAIVGATGTVRANQSTVLAWQTTGTVGVVHVGLDDTVKAGDTLAALDKTSLPQAVILASADLVTAQRNLDNLRNSQIAQAQAQLALSNAQQALDDLLHPSSKAISQAQLAITTAQDTLDEAQRQVNYLKYGRGSQEQITAARASYLVAQHEVDRLQGLYDQIPGSPEEYAPKAVALGNLEGAKAKRDRALANLNWFLGKPSAADIADKNNKLTLAQAQLDEAKKNLNKLLVPDTDDINLARAKLNDAQRDWDRLKDGPDPADVGAAEARVAATQATLKLQAIQAPFNGTITDAHAQAGDQVSPGSMAFRIDDLSRLLVDIQLSEVDVNRLAIGQPVTLSFDAIQGKNYTGQVSQVARVGTVTTGGVNFTVTVELTDADEAVRPGMTAAVNITVKQLKNVLLVPNRAVRTIDGQRVVYVLRNNQPTAVEILLGSNSDINSEILSGDVSDGDQAVLNPPIELRPGSGGMPFMGGR